MNTKIKQLKQEIQKLQDQLKELEEKHNQLPLSFSIESVLSILKLIENGDEKEAAELLMNAFEWDSTTQGRDYWELIYDQRNEFVMDDIVQLQKWAILYLTQKS